MTEELRYRDWIIQLDEHQDERPWVVTAPFKHPHGSDYMATLEEARAYIDAMHGDPLSYRGYELETEDGAHEKRQFSILKDGRRVGFAPTLEEAKHLIDVKVEQIDSLHLDDDLEDAAPYLQ